MDQEKEQIKVEKQMLNMTYIGFWKRLGAYFIDFLVLIPITFVLVKLQFSLRQSGSYAFLALNVLSTIISYGYRIFFSAKFGATPGKMAFKIKITDEEGEPLTLKQAFLRELLYIIYSLIVYILMIGAIIYFFNTTELHSAYEYQFFYNKSIFSKMASLFMYLFYIGDFIGFLTSPKKQALHDRIAKTVVVYK